MSEIVSDIAHKKIAIIGGSVSGILTALLLRAYGFRAIAILEKGPRIFPQNASFMNAGTLIHHLNFGGDPESFRKMVVAGLFFLKIFPDFIFSADRMNLLLPNEPQNPAIPGISKDSSALDNLAKLREIYQTHAKATGHTPFGTIDNLFHEMGEKQLRGVYGETVTGSDNWLGNQGVFHSAFNVAQRSVNPDTLISHLYSHLFRSDGNGIVVKTNSHVSDIVPVGGGFDVKNGAVNFGHYDAIVGQAHAGNFSLKMPGMSEKMPCHMRRKGLLLMDGKGLNIPPTVMIRGFYGAFLPVGDDKFLVISGRHFDLDTINFPNDGNDLQGKLHLWNTAPIGKYSKWTDENAFVKAVLGDVAERLPIVRRMQLIRPVFGTHVYDPSRENASADVASVRDRCLIAHEHQNGDSVFLAAGPTKLTTIPMSTVHIVNRILSVLSRGEHPGVTFNEYGFPNIPGEVLDSWVVKNVPLLHHPIKFA